MTHGSVAKRVRENKAAHPERYCSGPKCLWRIEPGKPCPVHTPRDILRLLGQLKEGK